MSYASKIFSEASRNKSIVDVHYEAAVRVSSLPKEQNLVCLAPDYYGVCYNRGPLSDAQKTDWTTKTMKNRSSFNDKYGGDMTFGTKHEEAILLDKVRDLLIPPVGIGYEGNSDPQYKGYHENMTFVDASINNLPGHDFQGRKIVFGPRSHYLKLKSATIGSGVNYKLYRCRVRYSLPTVPVGNNSTAFVIDANGSAHAGFGNKDDVTEVQEMIDDNNALYYGDCFRDWCSVLAAHTCMKMLYPEASVIASTYNIGYAGKVYSEKTYPDIVKGLKLLKQPGCTLSEIPNMLRFFEIEKTYKGKLLPGQEVGFKLNLSPKVFNAIENSLTRHNFCNSGEYVYFLKIYGEEGHIKFNPVLQEANPKNQNVENVFSAADPKPVTAGGAFFGQWQSRPLMGIMPAHVDVMCYKKMSIGVVERHKRQKVRQKVVADDVMWSSASLLPPSGSYNVEPSSGTGETNDTYFANNLTASNAFVDAYPSFFDASSAYIDQE